jgi:folylpolyglutamate synthase/dihydropteroate synthase
LDSAHNLEAVNALLKTLDELGIEDGFSLVYASHPKKDSGRILRRLAQRAGEIWCTTAPRLSPESDLLPLLKGRRGVHADASPIACLRSAQQRGKTVLVTGSIYLAGKLLLQLEAEG